MEYLKLVNLFLGASAILLQAISLAVLLMLIFSKDNKFLDFIKNNFLALGFILSFPAILASLFYSNVIGFVPCYLCWWQRIFMYPLIFIFGIAWWKKDKSITTYAFSLAIIGALISLYHNYYYYFTEGAGPCDASGVSCVQVLVNEFGGYISIPSLSLTSFAALIIILLVAKFYKKEA